MNQTQLCCSLTPIPCSELPISISHLKTKTKTKLPSLGMLLYHSIILTSLTGTWLLSTSLLVYLPPRALACPPILWLPYSHHLGGPSTFPCLLPQTPLTVSSVWAYPHASPNSSTSGSCLSPELHTHTSGSHWIPADTSSGSRNSQFPLTPYLTYATLKLTTPMCSPSAHLLF